MMGYSSTEKVTLAAREYNEDVRWGRFDQAASKIIKEERNRFIEKRSNFGDDLEIADYEITGIEVDKKKQTATARVEYQWMLKNRQLLEKTVTRQEWEKRGFEWVIVKEVRVKGAPLAIFDEKKAEE